jgi:hypothetical protein
MMCCFYGHWNNLSWMHAPTYTCTTSTHRCTDTNKDMPAHGGARAHTHTHMCTHWYQPARTHIHGDAHTHMHTGCCFSHLVILAQVSRSEYLLRDPKTCDILASQDYENAMDKCHWPENCEQQGSNQGEILPSHSSLCWFDKWPSRRHTWKWFQIRSSQAGWTR